MGLTSILVQGEKQKGIVYIVAHAQTKVKKTGTEVPVVKPGAEPTNPRENRNHSIIKITNANNTANIGWPKNTSINTATQAMSGTLHTCSLSHALPIAFKALAQVCNL